MNHQDRDLLREAALEGGEIAMGFFRQNPDHWVKEADKSPVTEADFAVDRALRAALTQARPDYGWLSEETPDDKARLDAQRCFIVDPIDGTRTFMEGKEGWAIALAVVDRGEPVAAVIHFPASGDLYEAHLGAGAFCNGQKISVSAREDLTDARLLMNRADAKPVSWQSPLPQIDQGYRQALSHRLALVADGRFDGLAALRPIWDWDAAPGTLLITEAGGRVTDRHGALPRFNSARAKTPGIVAAPPKLHEALLAHGPQSRD